MKRKLITLTIIAVFAFGGFVVANLCQTKCETFCSKRNYPPDSTEWDACVDGCRAGCAYNQPEPDDL